jgi:autotransporter-associated beta strand protein
MPPFVKSPRPVDSAQLLEEQFFQPPKSKLNPRPMKPRFALAALPLALITLTSTATAANRIRNTAVANLNTIAAWDDGLTATPGSSDIAVWNSSSSGGAQTLGDNVSWGGILIGSGTPSSVLFTNAANPSPFTLTLNADGIDLNGGAATNRGITFESNTAIALGANQTWKFGVGQSGANVVANSVISGTGSLSITRDSSALNYLQLGAANTFNGGLTLGSNSRVLLGTSSVVSGSSITSGPTGTGTLSIGEGSTISSTSSSGRDVASTGITVNGNFTIGEATTYTGRIRFNGALDLGNATRVVTVTNGTATGTSGNARFGFATITGSTIGNSISNGTLSVQSSATGGNLSYVHFANQVDFVGNAGLTLGNNVVTCVGTGSAFGNNAADKIPNLTLQAGGVLDMSDQSTGIRSFSIASLSGTGGSVTSNATAAGTSTLTINGTNAGATNNTSFAGSISNGATVSLAVTKTGSTTQTLSGTNSYTGKTTISGGTLQFGKQVSLYNNTPATWTDTNIQVDGGAMLALNVGGTGEFTASDVATLAALGTGSGGFKTTSRIGLDTTNASGGSFTYSNVLANPNAGANTLSLRKLGAGTLVLDQANTYTGGTTIEAGTLKVTQPAALSSSGTVTVNAGTNLDADFSGLGAAGTISRTIAGTGTINATPANTFQVSFSSGILTTFTGIVNVKPSPASSARVDFNGLLGSGATINIETGATGRLAFTGTYSNLTVNVAGTGGSGPGALRLQDTTLDSSCVVNLSDNASIGSFTPAVSTIATAIAESGGSRSLTKSGTSTLNLTAQNTYTGNTSVTGGTLSLGDGTTNTALANAADVTLAASTTLNLNYTGTDVIDELTINGVQKAAGIWGSASSGAPNTDPQLTGTGTLTVTTGPASNTPPTISDIANQTFPSGGNTGALAFTVTDEDVNSVTPSGSSSDTVLVPNGNIVFSGSGANRTVTVTPVSGLAGSATITVTITDNGTLTAQDTFTVTVTDNYLSWATANGVTGGPNGDSDNDGVRNLVEYALINGGERGTLSANTITFTKRGAPYGSDLTYDIESSTTLGGWSSLAKPPVVDNASEIKYTFTPGTPAKNFFRLKVVQAP